MDRPKLKWYDVNNKKPDIGQRVMIADDCADQVIIGTYTEDKEGVRVWELDCGADILTDHFPYWTDLPEHPQKSGGIVYV